MPSNWVTSRPRDGAFLIRESRVELIMNSITIVERSIVMLKIFNSLCFLLQEYIVVKYTEVCATINSGLCGKEESYNSYMSIVG